MNDCEYWGGKHKLYITGATDHFLFGTVYFSCRNCITTVQVDRFNLYQALKTPREVDRGA